jgi:DNA-binding MarR family transcriptional regulator
MPAAALRSRDSAASAQRVTPGGRSPRRTARIPSPDGLDRFIHEPARLGIVAGLAARGTMSFNELKQLLRMSDGNLSTHARVLEEAGYIAIEKSFIGRKPRTTMALTAGGSAAFRRYVDYLERIVSPRKE